MYSLDLFAGRRIISRCRVPWFCTQNLHRWPHCGRLQPQGEVQIVAPCVDLRPVRPDQAMTQQQIMTPLLTSTALPLEMTTTFRSLPKNLHKHSWKKKTPQKKLRARQKSGATPQRSPDQPRSVSSIFRRSPGPRAHLAAGGDLGDQIGKVRGPRQEARHLRHLRRRIWAWLEMKRSGQTAGLGIPCFFR